MGVSSGPYNTLCQGGCRALFRAGYGPWYSGFDLCDMPCLSPHVFWFPLNGEPLVEWLQSALSAPVGEER